MYNPLIHKRQSLRIKGYDYASEGLYFITIKTKDRNRLFGEITDGTMKLNEAGLIAENCWLAIPSHFPHAAIHDYVIMPDHIHGIIEIVYNPSVGAKNFSPLQTDSPLRDRQPVFKSPSKTIGSIVRGFKIGVTKWFRQQTTIHEIWQRNYHEHLIRDTEAYEHICEYIRDNPKNYNSE
jgi:REP element-mobilizing transposase RayT